MCASEHRIDSWHSHGRDVGTSPRAPSCPRACVRACVSLRLCACAPASGFACSYSYSYIHYTCAYGLVGRRGSVRELRGAIGPPCRLHAARRRMRACVRPLVVVVRGSSTGTSPTQCGRAARGLSCPRASWQPRGGGGGCVLPDSPCRAFACSRVREGFARGRSRGFARAQ